MEKKLAAALASRTDPDFCIIARTDARGVHGFDDAIQRGRAFAKLGVDAVFVEAPQSEAELEEIPRASSEYPSAGQRLQRRKDSHAAGRTTCSKWDTELRFTRLKPREPASTP